MGFEKGKEDKKICFVIVYFGKFPVWLPAFLLSCAHNPSIQWKIWNDIEDFQGEFPANVTSIPMTLEEFKGMATELIDAPIHINTPHKLCDFKPLYGDIFKAQLSNFDYWGHCDLDLVWGDIESFLHRIQFQQYDIISSRSSAICGHFTLYKNIPALNTFYTQVSNFRKVFLKPKYAGFDEGYFSYKLFLESEKDDFLYKIFWPKKHAVDWPELEIKPIGWKWKKGKIVNSYGQERIYLHFMKWKKSLNRIDFGFDETPTEFQITKNGIWSKEMNWMEKVNYFKPTHMKRLLGYYCNRSKRMIKRLFKEEAENKNPPVPEDYRII